MAHILLINPVVATERLECDEPVLRLLCSQVQEAFHVNRTVGSIS